jgi:hypothetical protein
MFDIVKKGETALHEFQRILAEKQRAKIVHKLQNFESASIFKDLADKMDKIENGAKGLNQAQIEAEFVKLTAPTYDPDNCDNDCRLDAVRSVSSSSLV